MMPRIVYLATADARGHLMRAQLLVHALHAAGAQVDVLTTSDAGQAFLAAFDIDAAVLSRHYAVQFDERQNMLRDATDRNVAHYVFRLLELTTLRRIAELKSRLQRTNPEEHTADYNRMFGELAALEQHRRTLRDRIVSA